MTLFYIFREVFRRPLGILSAGVLGLLYLTAIFAGLIAPYQTNEQDLNSTYHPPTKVFWKNGGLHVEAYKLVDPSEARYELIDGLSYPIRLFARGYEYRLFGLIPLERHLFQVENDIGPIYLLGSDSTGRDVFSRLVYGSQVSLFIGLVGITITASLGFLVGGLSGYFGGRTDFTAMRLVEFIMAIPGLYLLLALRGALAPYFPSDQMFFVIVIILALIGWAGTARILRGMTLSLRQSKRKRSRRWKTSPWKRTRMSACLQRGRASALTRARSIFSSAGSPRERSSTSTGPTRFRREASHPR